MSEAASQTAALSQQELDDFTVQAGERAQDRL